MEKEELVEMINSTINTNGSGAITGEALNLALQAIVETMGTGSASGAERLWGTLNISSEATFNVTDEEKALNAQLYTKIVSAIENDQPISVWTKATVEGATYVLTSIAIITADSGVGIIFSEGGSNAMPFALSSDGSVQIGG